MKKILLSLALVGFTSLFTISTASAIQWAPSSLQVDFRDTALWNSTGSDGDTGVASITQGDITVSASNNLSQYKMDGFGVYGPRPGGLDEIDTNELLTVTNNTGMSLSGAWLSDLFEYNDDYNQAESGFLWLNNGGSNQEKISFTATNGSTAGNSESVDNGEFFVAFNYNDPIYSIDFYPDYNSNVTDSEKNDYSVIGLSANPVPEPASMLLFATGLIGLAAGMKKKSAKS